VFLNEIQEQVTLEKLLWKEVYRQDAVSMYWVNVALEERIIEVININKKLQYDLSLAETNAIRATATMEHYRGLFKEAETTTNNLRSDNRKLRVTNTTLKIGVIGLGISTLYFGAITFIK